MQPHANCCNRAFLGTIRLCLVHHTRVYVGAPHHRITSPQLDSILTNDRVRRGANLPLHDVHDGEVRTVPKLENDVDIGIGELRLWTFLMGKGRSFWI